MKYRHKFFNIHRHEIKKKTFKVPLKASRGVADSIL